VKKLYVFAILLVVAAITLAAFSPGQLATLRVWNKIAGEDVNIKMAGIKYGVGYYLTAPGPTHKYTLGFPSTNMAAWLRKSTYDIRKDIYDVTIYLCDASRSGTINMSHAVRLVFPNCYAAVNSGEPGNEKVDVARGKPGTWNQDADSAPGDGAYPWGCGITEANSSCSIGVFAKNGDQIWWRLDWFNWWNGQNDVLEPFFP